MFKESKRMGRKSNTDPNGMQGRADYEEKSITCDVTVSLTAAELGEMILVVL